MKKFLSFKFSDNKNIFESFLVLIKNMMNI